MKRKILVVTIMMLMIVTSFNFLGFANENMTNENKLEKIKNAIKENNAQWTAGFNSIFTPEGDNDYDLYGCMKETIPIDEYVIIESCFSLPDSFDWRNVDGKNYVTSVKVQGPCGSCAAFGTIGALEAVVQIEFDEIFDCDLSEAFLFFCGDGSCNSGWSNAGAVDFVEYMGVVDELCFPYKPKEMDCDEKASNWAQRLVTVRSTGLVRGPTAIKEALINFGPVVTHLAQYEDYLSYTGGIYEHVWGEFTGWYHANTIIGYNDDPGYWICKETAGEGWGEDGFLRIKYGECEIDEIAYYFDGIGGNIQPCKPKNVYPSDGASNVDNDVNISWESRDVNGDSVTYSIYFNEGIDVDNNREPIVEGLIDNFFQVEDLKKYTFYSFRIIAEDEHGSQHTSDDIRFSTRLPLSPIIDGPTEARIGRECRYTASSTDVDGEDYYWFFEWGNVEDSGWFGPYDPQDVVTASYSWQEEGDYTIKARYNQDGLISDWGALEVSILKNKPFNPFIRFLENHTHLFPLIRQILGL
jgi:C1A family cysteine protease